MNSLFESHEKQYGNITSEITFSLGQLVTCLRDKSSESQDHVKKIENLFIDAKDLLQQMELEINSFDVNVRPKYKNRWQSHTKELENLEKEFKNVRYKTSNGFGDPNDGRDELFAVDNDPKLRLIKNTERLERSGHKLDDGYRMTIETEHIGTQILEDLSEQREKLTRSRDRLRETNEDLATSSRMLSRMTRKIVQNRLILAVVAIVMFLIIALCIYLAVTKAK